MDQKISKKEDIDHLNLLIVRMYESLDNVL